MLKSIITRVGVALPVAGFMCSLWLAIAPEGTMLFLEKIEASIRSGATSIAIAAETVGRNAELASWVVLYLLTVNLVLVLIWFTHRPGRRPSRTEGIICKSPP